MPFNLILRLTIIYNFALLYIVPYGEGIERFSWIYWAFLAGVAFFLALNIKVIVSLRQSRAALCLYVFLLAVCFVSVAREDYSAIWGTGALCLTLAVLLNRRNNLSITFLNRLFLVALVGSVAGFYLGINPHGFIPGQSGETLGSQEYSYRISLFPFTTDSAFFALIVFALNWLKNKSADKWFYLAAALYFVALGGSRTCLILLAYFVALAGVAHLYRFRDSVPYRLAGWGVLGLVVLLLNNPLAIVEHSGEIDDPLANKMLFRNELGVGTDTFVAESTIHRAWLWGRHLELFWQDPVLGIGKDGLETAALWGHFGLGKSGSESFLTAQLAKFGLLIIPFVLFLIEVQRVAMADLARYYLFQVVLFVAFFYGVMITPYSLVFFLLFGYIGSPEWAPRSLRVGHRKATNDGRGRSRVWGDFDGGPKIILSQMIRRH